jgi:hypothetical protein
MDLSDVPKKENEDRMQSIEKDNDCHDGDIDSGNIDLPDLPEEPAREGTPEPSAKALGKRPLRAYNLFAPAAPEPVTSVKANGDSADEVKERGRKRTVSFAFPVSQDNHNRMHLRQISFLLSLSIFELIRRSC